MDTKIHRKGNASSIFPKSYWEWYLTFSSCFFLCDWKCHCFLPLFLILNIALGGVAFAKNRCIEQSHGEYLCFQDADDVMYPERIQEQYAKASEFQDAIVGSYFEYESKAILQRHRRMPKNATRHYTEWMNALTDDDLLRYQYRYRLWKGRIWTGLERF